MSKYKKWYDALMATARTKPRQKHQGIYYEEHHILPRSLGGIDCVDNLVLLTAKEHFIAHLLLMKFTTGKDKYKMAHALLFMQNTSSSEKKFTSNSFAVYREQAIYLIRKNSPDSIPVTVRGIDYSSKLEASRCLGIDRRSITKIVSDPDYVPYGKEYRPKSIPVTIRGTTYPSKVEASRCLGISLYSINNLIEDPVYTPPPEVIVIKGISYPTYAAAEKALQLSFSVVKRMAHDPTYVHNTMPQAKPTTINNITYPSINAAARALNVAKRAISGLVERNGKPWINGCSVSFYGKVYPSMMQCGKITGITIYHLKKKLDDPLNKEVFRLPLTGSNAPIRKKPTSH